MKADLLPQDLVRLNDVVRLHYAADGAPVGALRMTDAGVVILRTTDGPVTYRPSARRA